MILAIISQIWIQHRHCGQIIGHCHLRVGSDLEPELGGALFTVLSLTLREVENTSFSGLSGLYGFQIPKIEGIGLFTAQNEFFRIYFLCEGLYTGSIPYLAGKRLMLQVKEVFRILRQTIPADSCDRGHKIRSESFWYDLFDSTSWKEQLSLKEIRKVYPLSLVHIRIFHNKSENTYGLRNIEAVNLGTLGHGWKEIDHLVSTKIEGILSNPINSYHIYHTIFYHFKEFLPEFEPSTVILAYNNEIHNHLALFAFISIEENRLCIRFCLPVESGISLEGDISIASALRSFYLSSNKKS